MDLCSDERQEHVRLDAVRLVQRLSPLVSEHEATSQLVPIWLKLAKDDSHAVRKAVAEVNTLFFRVSDDVFTEGLLRRFRKFCSDRIWSVRKAAVESMVKLSERCSPAQRSDLVPLYEKLLEDESRWVKSAAYQAIGPFIATLGRTDKLDTLLAYFRRMVFNQAAIGDSDAMSYCAFSFPGVLLTVGPDDWAKLQDIYEALTNSLLWKVRKTLAHSLHEIAKLLGIERTEEVLLPTFDKYLKDLDEVKVGVLKHFPQFLEYVRPETRTQYISICHDIQKDTLNWRFRKLIARDLAVLCRLFGPEVTISDLLPIAVDLLQDPVAVVRQTANASVGRVFEVLSSGQQNPAMAERFLDKLTEFGQDNYFISRQIFVHACASASQTVPPATLKEKLLPSLIRLADDKVPNVRLLVARTLSQLSRSPEFQTEEVTKALEKLKLDRDRDVVNEAQSVH